MAQCVRFPYIHDLAELLNLFNKQGEVTPPFLQNAVSLTDFAVEARYPGTAEQVSVEEYRETLLLAEQVVKRPGHMARNRSPALAA